MSSARTPRAVVVTRSTEYAGLLARHASREQARFFLETRGQSIDDVAERDRVFRSALQEVSSAIPVEWRRSHVDRSDLDRFLFEPGDIVLALGQDGLVANAAKYLTGQPVIGLDPEPGRNAGVLVQHPPEAAGELMRAAAAGEAACQERTMVAAELDDGQRLLALNEIFVGHVSHQSARYRLRLPERFAPSARGEAGEAQERQSSSGLIVSTGTGASGWARSIHGERGSRLELPQPTDARLVFFVREAWPSIATGTELTEGLLEPSECVTITSEMEQGVIFGDGIEADRIDFGWGRPVHLRVAPERLRLVV